MTTRQYSLSQGVLWPAYGRDYKTKAEIIKDFRAGKDFKIGFYNGQSTYCSIRDAQIGELIKLRYDKRTKAMFYAITAQDKKGEENV